MRSRFIRDGLRRFRVELILSAIVICSIAAVWHSVKQHDRAHARRLTMLAAAGIQADFEADLRERLRGQVRLAQLWSLAEEPSQRDWEAATRLYMDHYGGTLRLEWLDPSYRDRWSFPRITATTDDRLAGVAAAERRRVLELSRQNRQQAVSRAISLPTGETLLLAAVPIFSHGELSGFVLSTMEIQASLATMLADVSSLGYEFVILQDGKAIYAAGGRKESEQETGQDAELPLPTTGWTVRARPQPLLMQEMKSRFPEVLVATMAALGLVLIITVRLAKAARAANAHLMQEVCERRRMEEAARVSEARFAGILDISADAIISADSDQRIVLFNQGAEEMFGYRAQEVLGQPLDLLLPADTRAPHRHHVANFATSEVATMRMCDRRPVAGRRKDGRDFAAEATVSKFVVNGQVTFTAILRDITERVQIEEALRRSHDDLEVRVEQRTEQLAAANESLRELSVRLLTSQEEERRRIARELHDSTAQSLVLALMNLDRVQNGGVAPGEPAKELLQDCARLVEQATGELRAVSYRLHPPMLEEFGLSFALTWYINGFSERSGIHIEVTVDPNLGRLSHDAELAIFRIVQEALANVHRHAQAGVASVKVCREPDSVRLEVTDHGRGMQQETAASGNNGPRLGVGITGMRERVRQVGGTFELQSGAQGTTVTAVFPVSEGIKAA